MRHRGRGSRGGVASRPSRRARSRTPLPAWQARQIHARLRGSKSADGRRSACTGQRNRQCRPLTTAPRARRASSTSTARVTPRPPRSWPRAPTLPTRQISPTPTPTPTRGEQWHHAPTRAPAGVFAFLSPGQPCVELGHDPRGRRGRGRRGRGGLEHPVLDGPVAGRPVFGGFPVAHDPDRGPAAIARGIRHVRGGPRFGPGRGAAARARRRARSRLTFSSSARGRASDPRLGRPGGARPAAVVRRAARSGGPAAGPLLGQSGGFRGRKRHGACPDHTASGSGCVKLRTQHYVCWIDNHCRWWGSAGPLPPGTDRLPGEMAAYR
jgi:hypothetical protein